MTVSCRTDFAAFLMILFPLSQGPIKTFPTRLSKADAYLSSSSCSNSCTQGACQNLACPLVVFGSFSSAHGELTSGAASGFKISASEVPRAASGAGGGLLQSLQGAPGASGCQAGSDLAGAARFISALRGGCPGEQQSAHAVLRQEAFDCCIRHAAA